MLIGTAYIEAASVFPGGVIELTFLAVPGNLLPGDPGARGLSHGPIIGLKFFIPTHVTGCQALA